MHQKNLFQLYDRAIAYIQQHFMDERVDRLTIAAALECSTRQLSRAFEGRSITLNATIQLMRLYKGRELLRRKRNLRVAQVETMVYFRNAKHFTTQFKKHFGRTPSEERKALSLRRKGNTS